MPAPHGAIRKADRAVGVDLRRAVDEANVAQEGNELYLLIDRNIAIGFLRGVEPTKPGALQRANRGEMARRNRLVLGKFRQAGDDFIAFRKDHRIGLFSRFAILSG